MPPRQTAPKISEGRSRYQTLTNLSLPQYDPDTGKRTGQTDLVGPGEIVELTEAEAAHLMRTDSRSGHRAPLIRPASEKDQPLPRLHPRHASGVNFGPPAEARPDPAGASSLQVQQEVADPALVQGMKSALEGNPEANEPQLGSEGQLPSELVDALDITPAR